MTRATWRAGAALSVLTLATLGVRADDAKLTGDLMKMQGTWVNATDDGPELRWTLEGDVLKATINGQEYTGKITLDEKATPHPTADVALTEGPNDAAGKTSKSIYKFDGQKLVFCASMPGADSRPAKFESVDGEAHLFDMKKEKVKGKDKDK